MTPTFPRLSWAALVVALLSLSPLAPIALPEGKAAMESTRDRQLPQRWQGRFLEEPIFDGRVYVVEAGSPKAPTLLLVHGLGQSGYQDWWEVIDTLETDYHVVALDLPGFARSPVPKSGLSPQRYSRLLYWLTQELDLGQTHLVGHSMGAAIALYFTAHHPEQVNGLVVSDVAGILNRASFLSDVVGLHEIDSDLPSFLVGSMQNLLDQGKTILERLLIASDINPVEVLQRSQTAWEALLAGRPHVNAAISLLETNFSTEVHSLSVPTTIVWGSEDDVVPMRTGHLLHGLLPRNAFHIIGGAGHAPMRTHPDQFLDHLRNALAAPPKTGRPPPQGSEVEDFICRDGGGRTLSGRYGRIGIDNCSGMKLVDVQTEHVRIRDSDKVLLRHVEINAPDGVTGLEISGSDVRATDLSSEGDPAVQIDGSQFDLAGGILRAPDAALVTHTESTVLVSVTRVISGVRNGYLHGALKARDAILDGNADLLGQGSSP